MARPKKNVNSQVTPTKKTRRVRTKAERIAEIDRKIIRYQEIIKNLEKKKKDIAEEKLSGNQILRMLKDSGKSQEELIDFFKSGVEIPIDED